MRSDIESFLHKPMTRKNFLRHLGMILLSIGGIGSILKYLNSGGISTNIGRAGDYGSNQYGGDKTKPAFSPTSHTKKLN